MAPEQIYSQIQNKLKGLKKKIIKISFISSFLSILFWGLGITFCFLLAEYIFYMETPFRTAAFFFWSAALIIAIFIFLIHPARLLSGSSEDVSAKNLSIAVGGHFPEINDRLLNIIQLFNNKKESGIFYSSALIDQALIKYGQPALKLDFNSVISLNPVKKQLQYLLIPLLILASSFIIHPTGFYNAFNRLIHPYTAFAGPIPFSFMVEPGSTDAVKGEDLTIKVFVKGESPESLILYTKTEDQEKFRPLEFISLSPDYYNCTIKNVKESFHYFIEGRKNGRFLKKFKLTSETYIISLLHRPEVSRFQVKLNYPEYSGLPSKILPDNSGNITALKGTKVDISISPNKPVTEAKINFAAGPSKDLDILVSSMKTGFTLIKDNRYWFSLKDRQGLENPEPIKYKINIMPDEYPFISVIQPGRDIDIGEDMLISFILKTGDDFGLSTLRLAYKKVYPGDERMGIKRKFQFIPVQLNDFSGSARETFFTWHLDDLDLLPDDRIVYYFEVFDNDNISGPKNTVSPTFYARYPSLYEIFSEVEKEQNVQLSEMESLLKESKDVQEKLKKVSRELKKNRELDWKKKKTLDNAVKKQDDLNKKLDQAEKKMDQLVEKIEKNSLTSQQTLKKYLEIQKILQELKSPQLRKAMENMKKAMEKLNPPNIQQLSQNMQLKQEEFLKKLERTYNLLKQIQLEQKMDEVVKKAEELLTRQKDITEKVKKGDTGKEQVQREQKLSKDTDALQKNLNDLMKKMENDLSAPKNQLKSTEKYMKEKQIAGDMKNMSRDIQEKKTEKAASKGKNIESKLDNVKKQLQNAQNQMRNQQKQAVQKGLQDAVKNILALSKKQEELRESTKILGRTSPQMRENANKQNDLHSGLSRTTNKLMELSNKTFYVTQEMGKSISKALSSMKKSISSFEQRNSGNAAQMQSNALGALNETAMNIQSSLNSLKKSGSASGMEQLMQQLQKLSEQQKKLNQQTMQGQGNPLTQQMMQQMAAEQEMIRKALEKLMENMSKNRGMMKDLDNVGKSMGEVAKDLKSKKISPQTKMRQKEILQRLLDAQKSLHKRDYSKKRKSETAKDYTGRDPLSLPDDYGEAADILKQWRDAALQEGYSHEIKVMIQEYFEQLKKHLQEKKR